MTFNEIKENDTKYIVNTYARFPVALKSGKGATAVDFDGRKYIDFTSGIGVNSLGFCDDDYVKAVSEQLAALQHTSNLYYTEPQVLLAKTLCVRTGMSKVFFANSGAEANEGAIKTARKYSFMKYGEGRSTIVTLENSFHGRTITTLSATGQDVFHNFFFPFTDGFVFAKANDIDDTLSKLTDDVAAVMLEMVQGEGGVLPLSKEYVTAVARACKQKDILLIVDEVQTGVGRTGTLFAYEQYGVEPDLVTFAKGIGGGLPLGGVLFNSSTESVLVFGDHATTFGGNPAVCAGANTVLKKLDEKFLSEVRKKGDYIRNKISKMPRVKEISGLGMMIGVSLDGVEAKQVVSEGLKNGVILLTAKTKLRLLPPLSISCGEIDEGLAALETTLNSF